MGGGGGQELPRAAVLQSSDSQKPPAPVSPFRRAEDLLKVPSSGLLGMQREGGRTLMEEGGTPSPSSLPLPLLPKPRLSQPPTKARSGYFMSGPPVALWGHRTSEMPREENWAQVVGARVAW